VVNAAKILNITAQPNVYTQTAKLDSLVVNFDTTASMITYGASTVVNSAYLGVDGALVNGATYSPSTMAFVVDGVDDYVSGTLPSTATGAWPHTVSMWFNRTVAKAPTGNDYLFRAGASSTGNMTSLLINNNVIRSNVFGAETIGSTTIALNIWYHLALTYSGGAWSATNVKLYVNGVLEGGGTGGTGAGTTALTLAASSPFQIGYVAANQAFAGSISNFKIWNGVLTPAEVFQEYSLERIGKFLSITDTAVCIGGLVPRSQLDVRGSIISSGAIDAGTQFLGQAADSASAPSFSFTGDTNLGMFRPGTDILGFTTTGTERARILANGNFGIANTAPVHTLSIGGNAFVSSNLTVGTANLHVNTTTGRVGVGTTLPAYKLDVAGTANVGALTTTSVSGNGSGLTELNGTNISSGTVDNARLPATLTSKLNTSVTPGSYLTGSAYDGSVDRTFAVDATSANTANKVVARDGSGACAVGALRAEQISLGTSLYPNIGGNWLTINQPTYNGSIGPNNPDPEGGILFTNSSSGSFLEWGYYIGMVKDVASTGTSSVRLDIGKTYNVDTQGTTGGTNSLTTYLTIDNGNVGIGTVTPAYKLDVAGTANVGALTALTATVPNDGDFVMGGKSIKPASGLTWDSVNSRLGVGTAAPNYKLHVAGTGIFDSVGTLYTSSTSVFDIKANENGHIGYLKIVQNLHSAGNVGWERWGTRIQKTVDVTDQGYIEFNPPGNTYGIGFGKGTTEFMTLNSAGRLGIGTTSPVDTLHLHGGLPTLRISTNTTNSPAWCFQGSGESGDGFDLRYRKTDGTNDRFILFGSRDMSDATVKGITLYTPTGGEAIRIDASGNVGIGTVSPAYKLHVDGTAFMSSNLSVGTANLHVDTTTGRVGVGTTAPSQALHVIGNILSSGSIDAGTQFLGQAADSAVTPSFSFTGDTDLGIFRPGTNQLGFTMGGTEKARFLANGNFGLATTNPSQKLHVIGNILSSGTIECGVQIYGTVSDSPGAPSFSFSGDTDTGMFRAGGNVLCFATGGTEKVRIDGSGNFGIGATPTRAQLEVIGSNGSTTLTGYYALTGTGVSGPLTQTNPYGIYTNSRIAASQFNATSDVRIKKNIRDIVDSSALDTFRLLEPKIYNYIDEVQRGTSNVYGFIAQDVSNIMPYAVTLSTSEIPNILEVANVSQSNVLTFINFNTSNLESNTVIQIIDINGNRHDITLVELIDDHTIRVAEDVSKWSKSVDNDITETITVDEYEALADKTGYVAVEDTDTYTKTTSVRISEQIFVYGQNINDFHHLNKDSIWTVATAALQEVDRQQQADKVRIAQLESQLATVLARLDALENI